MRIRHLLAGAAIFAFAAPAWAQSAPVSFSPEFQTSLEEDFGVREGEVLRTAVTEAIARELAQRGVSSTGLSIDVTIVDAEPNRPTMQQLFDIYTGKVTNWKQVGGNDTTIILYSRENSSGTYIYFRDNVLRGKDFSPRAQTLQGTAAVVNAVAAQPFVDA